MKKIILLLLFVLFLMPAAVFAKSYTAIDMKDSFVPGEEVAFSYSIRDELGLKITVTPYLACEKDLPQPIPEEKEISLEAGKTFVGEYKGIMLSPDIPGQKCRAIVASGPDQEILAEKEFLIISKPALDIDFLFCTDEQCGHEARIFTTGQPVYINYRSDYKPPIRANIRSEKNNISDTVVLPAFYKFSNAGDYYITYEIMADGFQKINQEKNLTVISSANLQTCNNNGKCETGENIDNCSIDCPVNSAYENEVFFKKYKNIIIFAVLIIFAILITAFGIFFVKRKKRNNDNN